MIDCIDMKLKSVCQKFDNVEYSIVPEKIIDYISEVKTQLQRRYDFVVSDMRCDMEKEPLYLIINKNPDAIKILSGNTVAMADYKEIISKYKNLKVATVHSHIPNAPIQFNGLEVLKLVKDSRKYIFFDDISNIKIAEVNPLLIRELKKTVELGDGFVIKDGGIEKVKTVVYKDN